jgi:outer membrane protein assembly factor BamB
MERREFIKRAGYTLPFSESVYEILFGGYENPQTSVKRDTAPGTAIWEHGTEREIRASPTVSDGVVYIGTYQSIFDGAVQADDTPSPFYALDAETGEEIWRFGTDEGVGSTATVDGELVYFGTNDGTVRCLGKEDGDERWSFNVSGGIRSSPVVSDNTLYIGSVEFGTEGSHSFATNVDEEGDTEFRREAYGSVYGIHAGTGEVKWSFDSDGAVISSPILKDSVLYFTSEEDAHAVDAETGEEVWSFEHSQPSTSTPTVAGGRMYLGETSWEDSTVYAIDTETGEEVWSADRPRSVRGSPTVYDGTLYHGCEDGAVYAVDTETGETVWRSVVGGLDELTTENIGMDGGKRIRSSVTVAENRLYVGSYDGSLYALDTEDGEEVWGFETGGNVHSSPVLIDGTVYFGSFDGSVYGVETDVDASGQGSRAELGAVGYIRRS